MKCLGLVVCASLIACGPTEVVAPLERAPLAFAGMRLSIPTWPLEAQGSGLIAFMRFASNSEPDRTLHLASLRAGSVPTNDELAVAMQTLGDEWRPTLVNRPEAVAGHDAVTYLAVDPDLARLTVWWCPKLERLYLVASEGPAEQHAQTLGSVECHVDQPAQTSVFPRVTTRGYTRQAHDKVELWSAASGNVMLLSAAYSNGESADEAMAIAARVMDQLGVTLDKEEEGIVEWHEDPPRRIRFTSGKRKSRALALTFMFLECGERKSFLVTHWSESFDRDRIRAELLGVVCL